MAFRASRYGKSLDGSDDYINCPFTKEQYEIFVDALLEAGRYEPHIPEDKTPYFEGCLPIEEIARRGRDTLRFGPMKPMGLDDPRTGRRPYAVVQLRQENQRADSFNLVGFQNHMRIRRSGAHFAADSRTREGRVCAVRPDAPQYLHQLARGFAANAAK